MTLLALDLATSTGFAIGDPLAHRVVTPLEAAAGDNVKPVSGRFVVARPKTDLGPFLVGFEDWLTGIFDEHRVTQVVFEMPWIGAVKDPRTDRCILSASQTTLRKLTGLAGMTEAVAHRRGLSEDDIWEANNASVRKHFIGKGKGKRDELKRLTIEACQVRGWDPMTDDEADALALFDYACHFLQNKEAA